MQKEAIDKFIIACQAAEDSFGEWLNSMDERELRTYFKDLVEIKDHLESVIEKIGTVLDGH